MQENKTFKNRHSIICSVLFFIIPGYLICGNQYQDTNAIKVAYAISVDYDDSTSKWCLFDTLLHSFENSINKKESLVFLHIKGENVIKMPIDFSSKFHFVYFGEAGIINYIDGTSSDIQKTDSILYADKICGLAFYSPVKAYAIVENNGKRYLAKRLDKNWETQPENILIANSPFKNRNISTLTYIVLGIFYCVLAVIYVFWIRIRKIKKQIEHKTNIHKESAIFTKSDIPLGKDDEDLLGFTAIENAVINVIRNPETALPLTLVISGKWGSGKSSMMNRIRQKLETDEETKGRFLTTWFNAWHLQGEKNLLNTFLISITKFYEKSSYGFFRLKLFIIRFLKVPFLKQMLLWSSFTVIVSFVFLIFYKIIYTGATDNSILDLFAEKMGEIISDVGNDNTLAIFLKISAGIVSLLSIVFLKKEFKPAGLDTFVEILNLQQFKTDAEKQKPGYREKFKTDFWDILKARDSSLKTVVFIDDIDRISGDKVLELLEAINFISDAASSPLNNSEDGENLEKVNSNMIFILGMATEEVARNLGTQLKKLNNSTLDNEKMGLYYIEKMVQLVVSVPFDESNEKLNQLVER